MCLRRRNRCGLAVKYANIAAGYRRRDNRRMRGHNKLHVGENADKILQNSRLLTGGVQMKINLVDHYHARRFEHTIA